MRYGSTVVCLVPQPKRKPYHIVLFDLDNVLIDSEPNMQCYVQQTFRECGLRPPSKRRIRQQQGLRVFDIFKGLCPDEETARQLYNHSKTISRGMRDDIPPFPDAMSVLVYLSEKYTLGVVTSRDRESADYLLERHGMREYFAAIVVRNDTEHHKPHPEPLLKCMEQLSADSSETVYIGDTKHDRQAAASAEVDFVMLTGKQLRRLKRLL